MACKRYLYCCLLLLSVLLVGQGDACGEPVAQAGGSLLFMRDGRFWLATAQGSDARKLCPGEGLGSYWRPVWDRKGRRFAWVEVDGVWVYDTARASRFRVPMAPPAKLAPWGTPAWDGDGNGLYVGGFVSRQIDADGGLWRIPVQRGGKAEVIFPAIDADYAAHLSPKISPGGRYLASGYRAEVSDLRVYDLVRRRELGVTKPKAVVDHHLDYEWCGEGMLLVSCDTHAIPELELARGPGGVWKWDLVTGKATPWLAGGLPVEEVAVSPKGRLIAFVVGSGGAAAGTEVKELRVYDSAGKGTATVWRGRGKRCTVGWSPDGQALAVLCEQGGIDGDLWVVNRGTGKARLVAHEVGGFAWRPGGSR